MNKKKIIASILPVLFLLTLAAPVSAASPSYKYRSTVLGEGVRSAGGSVNAIVNERTDFDTNDSVYFLTRIFAITNVDRFQFRHDIIDDRGSLERRLFSDVYSPRGKFWAETYYWNGIEPMSEGAYDVRAFISVNGGAYKELGKVRFTVGRTVAYSDYNGYYNGTYDRYDGSDCSRVDLGYGQYYFQGANCRAYAGVSRADNSAAESPYYNYAWSKTGTGYRDYGSSNIEITGERPNFSADDSVNIVTRLESIRGLRNIRVKHELYQNGVTFVRRFESSTLTLDNRWRDRFDFASNFGRLPNGYHEIRIFVSIDGGSWKQIDKQHISVGRYGGSRPEYVYGWTNLDGQIDRVGPHTYELRSPQSDFTTDENVIILTKLANIRGMEKFTVRHTLLHRANGGYFRQLSAPTQYPGGGQWEYNHSWTDFGKLPAGDFEVLVEVQVNNSNWIHLDRKAFTVRQVSDYHPNFDYEGTWTGTDIWPRY